LSTEGGHSFDDAALAAPVLAMIGALAVVCFVKLFGAVFLGTPRTDRSSHAHESGPMLIAPMLVLVACCFTIGLAPTLVVPILAKAVSAWAPEVSDAGARLTELAPLGWVSTMAIILVFALGATTILLASQLRGSNVVRGPTWGCGFAAPTPRIQYTSSSFAEMLVKLFRWALRPRTQKPKIVALFPRKTIYRQRVLDPVLDEAVLPTCYFAAEKFSWFRIFQQGKIQAYLLYIFVALVALMLCGT
jgi:hydrogenase-4 component B